MFGTEEEPTALAAKVCLSCCPPTEITVNISRQVMSKKTTAFETSSNGETEQRSKLSRIKLTDDEKKRLQERIKKATSLQEIIALEKELNEGRLPAGVLGDPMEE